VVVWTSGCMDQWLYGPMVVCAHGNMILWPYAANIVVFSYIL